MSSSFEEAFLSRLVETGATETSSANDCLNSMKEDEENASEKIKNILFNIVAAINGIWQQKDGLHANKISEHGKSLVCWCIVDICCGLPPFIFFCVPCVLLLLLGAGRHKESCELVAEVKNLRLALSELHLKHKSVARELQSCRDIDAKSKAELKQLKGIIPLYTAESYFNKCTYLMQDLWSIRSYLLFIWAYLFMHQQICRCMFIFTCMIMCRFSIFSFIFF